MIDNPTDVQAAFLMRHLSPDDREWMIRQASNVIDARHWFADNARRLVPWLTDSDVPA